MKIILKEGWVAKDKFRDIFWYKSKPTKTGLIWSSVDEMYSLLESTSINIPDLGPWDQSLHRITKNGELVKEHPDLKIDQKVIVWNDEDYKCKRYFSGWSENCKIQTFDNGKTSFSNDGNDNEVSDWDHYEIVD